MGRLEKIVVVTVLFLVAVILGISLNSESDAKSKNPLAGAAREGAAASRDAEAAKPPASVPAPLATNAPGGVMSTGGTAGGTAGVGTPSAENVAPKPLDNTAKNAVVPSAPANPGTTPVVPLTPNAPQYLVSSEGLEATKSEDFMLYTWKVGDSFDALAAKFYGSKLHVSRIKVANEGVDETSLAAGAKVLISVKPTADADVLKRASTKAGDVAAADAKWTGGLYTVKTGDVLGTISSAVYGTTKKWKKIYDANRDVIGDDPNKLKVGTKLRIPE